MPLFEVSRRLDSEPNLCRASKICVPLGESGASQVARCGSANLRCSLRSWKVAESKIHTEFLRNLCGQNTSLLKLQRSKWRAVSHMASRSAARQEQNFCARRTDGPRLWHANRPAGPERGISPTAPVPLCTLAPRRPGRVPCAGLLGPGPEDPKAVEVFQEELVGKGNAGNLTFRAQGYK